MVKDDESSVLLHLVNYDVTIRGEINPASNVVCQLALPKEKSVERAWLYRPGKERLPIELELDGETTKVTVPKMDIYALVAVELK